MNSCGPKGKESIEVVDLCCIERLGRNQVGIEPSLQGRPSRHLDVFQIFGRRPVRDLLVAVRRKHDDVGECICPASLHSETLEKVLWKEMVELLLVVPRKGVCGVDLLAGQQIDRPVVRENNGKDLRQCII